MIAGLKQTVTTSAYQKSNQFNKRLTTNLWFFFQIPKDSLIFHCLHSSCMYIAFTDCKTFRDWICLYRPFSRCKIDLAYILMLTLCSKPRLGHITHVRFEVEDLKWPTMFVMAGRCWMKKKGTYISFTSLRGHRFLPSTYYLSYSECKLKHNIYYIVGDCCFQERVSYFVDA